MVAVAAGDAAEAGRQARRADVLLNEPPLTMLLSAQAAQLSGDEAAAGRYFRDMLERPETAFLGLRGLLIQAQRNNDPRAALEYAERAYELQPKTPWVLTTMFELQVREGRWRAALSTLEEAVKRKAVSAADARDQRAAVLLGCSDEAEAENDLSGALRYARRANTLAPDFLPAVLRTVDLLVRTGKERAATRMIQEAWSRTPHPELARIYGDIGGSDDPLKRVKRYERLLSFNTDHPESHIALAEASLAAELWGEARNHLDRAAGDDPSARVCRLMADLEERESGSDDAVRRWLVRASDAPPDPVWLCGDCGAAWDRWMPVCGDCGALGTLRWAPPARARTLALGSSGEDAGAESTGPMEEAETPAADDAVDTGAAAEDGRPSDETARS
jgi:HemY protein